MLTTIFTKTLRDQRRGLIGWSIGIGLTVIMMAAIWPSLSDMDLNAILDDYPEALTEAFNIADMSTGAGYLNGELFSFVVPAMFIIFAIGRGARLIAGEEEDGTLETLATLPVSRTRVLLEKAAGLTVGLGVLAVVLLVTLWSSGLVFDTGVPLRHAFHAALAMFLMGLEFGLLALALSAALGRRGLAIGIAGATAGATYLLFVMTRILDALEPFQVLSPFHQALSEGPIGPDLPPIMAIMAVTGLVVLAISVPVFRRRDLAV